MTDWHVKLDFRRDPKFGPATQGDWDRLFEVAGAFVGWTGPGVPDNLTSNLTVEADNEQEALDRATEVVRQRMEHEDLVGWLVEADQAWLQEDTAEDGYDPGPPPDDN